MSASRIGYFDCFAGASGDMILACLLDVGLRREVLAEALSSLGIDGIEFDVKDVLKKNVRAASFSFRAEGKAAAWSRQHSGTFKEIVTLIEGSGLAASVRERALEAFDLLAGAEARIHGTDKASVHFHEVGSLDSIVDVIGSFAGIEALGLVQIICSPLAVGMGVVNCEHGTLPSPAPATLEIAAGLPVRGVAVDGELTTPTAAAILKTCASDFGPMPGMILDSVGYGAGTRDLPGVPNVMRLVVGKARPESPSALEHDRVSLIETNIDDINPQLFPQIYDDLFAGGALDVWVENILMKKGRPGFLLSVLARPEDAGALAGVVLARTTTSGVRLRDVDRLKLPRRIVTAETRFGTIRAKVFTLEPQAAQGSSVRCAPEYEDCLRAAREHRVAVSEVIEETKHVVLKMLSRA
jgi:uncharacterized protein (TIGR00299 family) protein